MLALDKASVLTDEVVCHKSMANGLQAVEEITQRLGLSGVYGPLYKLFTVEDRYKLAVEVTAGQR